MSNTDGVLLGLVVTVVGAELGTRDDELVGVYDGYKSVSF